MWEARSTAPMTQNGSPEVRFVTVRMPCGEIGHEENAFIMSYLSATQEDFRQIVATIHESGGRLFMIAFKRKVLFVGYGAVAKCALPILLKLIKIPCANITVMDFEDRRGVLQPWIERGVKFVQQRVTEQNMGSLLGKYLKKGDLLIDLAWNIDCCEILQWCHDRGILYVNTSVESGIDRPRRINTRPSGRFTGGSK